MQDKEFDSTIKKSLQNLEVPFDAASWDLLEQKMQSRKTATGYAVTDDVDNVVQKALLNMEVAYDPKHWDKMSKKLDNSNVLRQRIMITKFAEAAIFLLLVWNFGSVLFTEKESLFKPKPLPAEQDISDATPRSNNKHSVASVEKTLSTTLVDLMTGNVSLEAALLNTLAVNTANTPEKTEISAQNSNTILAALPSTLVDNTTEEQTIRNQSARTVFGTYAFLPSLPIENVNYERNNDAFKTVVIEKHREKKYYVSNYASATRNRIRTPYDQESQKPAYEQWNDGYGAGIAFGKKSKKWGIETGLAYNSVTYSPRKNIKIVRGNTTIGYAGTYLKEMDLDLVSIPVSANRKIVRIGKSTLSAKIGITAHAVTQSAYRYETVQLPPATPTSGGPDQQYYLPTTGKGVLEGGSFKKNAWVTTNAGLRLERPINCNTSVFIEPMYSSVLAGKTGPKNDKIAGLALNAGVTSRL
jgi:hypothetical protein